LSLTATIEVGWKVLGRPVKFPTEAGFR